MVRTAGPTRDCPGRIHVTRDDVQRWLDAYVDAWRTYDRGAIGDLFAEDARYAYQPYREPVVGREAIVADWLEDPDAAGSWDARYEPYAVDGDRAVAVGESRYLETDGSLKTVLPPMGSPVALRGTAASA